MTTFRLSRVRPEDASRLFERVPITALDRQARGLIKRAIGFRENRLPAPGRG